MIKKNFWKNKRVLITGHTGFKGGWLSVWLKFLGAKIAGYSLNPITKKNFFQIVKIKNLFEYDFREDIKNYNKLSDCIKKFKPEIIFHLAAQPQVLESYASPYNTVLTNVVGTTNILNISMKNKCIKSLVIITTDKVYKNLNKKVRFVEEDTLGGDDLYSSSKASADIITSSYFNSFFKKKKCGIASVRAGNCIGGGDWTKFRILTDASESFLENKKLIVRNPNSVRPWQHVLEPLLGYLILAQKLFGNKKFFFSSSWNFGPKKQNQVKVKDFTKVLKNKMKSKSKIILNKKTDNREKKYLDLNSKKSTRYLGWKSFLTFNMTLDLTAEWYLAYKKRKNMLQVTTNQIQKYMKFIKNDL